MIDLSKHTASSILKDKVLLDAYKLQYEQYIGELPDCVPCKMNNGLSKLLRVIKSKKGKKMTKKANKYKVKKSKLNAYFSYREKGKRTVHLFGKNMSDEHAEKYIKFGVNPKTEKERKELFEVLPLEEPKVEEKKPKVEEKKPKADKKAK